MVTALAASDFSGVDATSDLSVESQRDARVRQAVLEHHALVYRLLRRLSVPERDVEDAQQQVFWVYARNLERVEIGKDRAFLFGVALRVAQTERARLGRMPPPSDDTALGNVVASVAGADDQLDDRRERAHLDALLARMQMDLRVVLVLHEIEEWTMRDIALALDLKPGTVASRLRRARAELEHLVRTCPELSRGGR
jgi:RNA polymerase sigma-70 factor (ECF subfamily)